VKFVNTTANSYHTLKPYRGGLDAWDTNFPWLETWGQTTYDITACVHTANPDTITVAEDLSGFTTNYKIKISGSTANDGEYTVDSSSGTGPTTVTLISSDGLTDSAADGTIHIALGQGVPTHYVRRRQTIEIAPVPNAGYTGKEIWVDFDRIPSDISSSATPLLTDADEIIINRAVGECMLRGNNMGAKARSLIAISEGLILERLEGEIDNDQADALWDRGP
jgi:dUTPase